MTSRTLFNSMYESVDETTKIRMSQRDCTGKIVAVSSNKAIVELLPQDMFALQLEPLDEITLFFKTNNTDKITGKVIRIDRNVSTPKIIICINKNHLKKWEALTKEMIDNYKVKLKEAYSSKIEETEFDAKFAKSFYFL